MARIRKGGRKKSPERDRYKCGQPKPATNDIGPVEQRLKRDIAAGRRTLPQAIAIATALDKLDDANVPHLALNRSSVQKAVRASGLLNDAQISAITEFNMSPPTHTGTDALDVLLGRNIISHDQFDTAVEFAACWCAYIGRPWPKGWKAERQSPDHNGGMSEAQLARMKIRYWNCLGAMNDVHPQIWQTVCDLAVHNKSSGMIHDALSYDVVRLDGTLVARKHGVIPPSLRSRIGLFTRGLDIIADVPQGDFSREAKALLAILDARNPRPKSLTRP